MTTVLLGIRDDITRAMKRGEVTILMLVDFSKAFDTIKYKTFLKKLNLLGFSKDYLKWTIQYLTGRKHFGFVKAPKKGIVKRISKLNPKRKKSAAKRTTGKKAPTRTTFQYTSDENLEN